jgi:hypothetical protein
VILRVRSPTVKSAQGNDRDDLRWPHLVEEVKPKLSNLVVEIAPHS